MPRQAYTTDYLNIAMESRYYFSDRDVSSKPTLPYTFYDIKIKPNDLVTTNAINGSLGKLYDNLLHIISQSRVPQTVIPRKKEFSTIIAVDSNAANSMSLISEFDSDQIGLINQNSELTGAVHGFASNHGSLTKSSHAVFTQSLEQSDEIGITMFYDDDSTGVQYKAYTTDLDNYTNRKLRGVNKMINHENTGYILDTESRVVYKYDITGLLTDDASYFDPSQRTNGKLLLDFIGGQGDINDNMRFFSPKTMCSDTDGYIYIVDSSPSKTIVKRFDKNTNYIEKYDITEYFSAGEQPVDVVFMNNRMFLLTNKNILEMSKKFLLMNNWDQQTTHVLSPGEQYKQILQSKEDKNVMYVVTSKNIIKKFISKPDKIISLFKYDNRGFNISNTDIDIAYVSITESPYGEYVYVCDKSNGIIYKFNESMSYQKCVDDSFEQSFIKLHDIEIKSDEFVSHLVYNKALSKMIYNHFLIGNNITGKLMTSWVDHYQKRYVGTRYTLPEQVFSRELSPVLDNFIGVNEPLMSSVVNRTLKKIYDLQILILKDIETEVLNSRPPLTVSDQPSIIPDESFTWSESEDGEWVLK